ncbi:hypothetical protein EZS27_001816 [termite gut metagenome]|uniref:Uncharacterized protein n=1 Tax=termite gut metagenome TaxID=433724 RepID=A0A5J4SY49_9ZZZZ
MKQGKSTKKRQPKSVRLGWESVSEQKPQLLSKIVGNGIKVEAGMFSKNVKNSNWLIP